MGFLRDILKENQVCIFQDCGVFGFASVAFIELLLRLYHAVWSGREDVDVVQFPSHGSGNKEGKHSFESVLPVGSYIILKFLLPGPLQVYKAYFIYSKAATSLIVFEGIVTVFSGVKTQGARTSIVFGRTLF